MPGGHAGGLAKRREVWWWGTYPEAGLGAPTGAGEGLWVQTASGAAEVMEVPAPSFVIGHPDLPLIYAATEETVATVLAVDVSIAEAPTVVGRLVTGGADACHLALSPDALTLYVAHYSSGDIAVVPLGADGAFSGETPAQLLRLEGSGPVAGRQESPHAHFVGYAPGGADLLVSDLGSDSLWRFAILPDGRLRADGKAADLPAGSGPRHFAIRDDKIHVVCELDHTLTTLEWDSGARSARLVSSIPTTAVPLRTGDAIYDAHIVSTAGVLLVSVRGPDVISVFDVGANGLPTLRGSFDSGGSWPRHFEVIGERVVVGNQNSHLACAFDLADVLALVPADDPAVPVTLAHADTGVMSPACVCSL